jgi:hypothetical protein
MFKNEWTYNGSNGNNYYGLFRSWGLGIQRVTSTPGDDIVLPESEFMFGHAGEAYGLVSDAYIDTTRKVGLVFLTNGVGTGYQTNSYSAFYTVEQEIFDAIENYADIGSCSQVSGIGQNPIPAIQLYPNPCVEYIKITSNNPQDVSLCKIYNVDGRLLKNFDLEKGETVIDLQDLKGGVYILESKGKKYSFIKM